jgi:hypothetical protein
MALDRKKLQKKKAKKVAKDKIRKTKQKKEKFLTGTLSNMAMKQALHAPVYECWEPEQLFETGIGTVIVSRKTEGNEILMAMFLLDVYCLGVKNSGILLMNEEEYRFRMEHLRKHETPIFIHPSCARKLVEETEEYAEELGFSPHKDYKNAKKIFGEIEKNACPRSFEFGKNGKPVYISGPYDSAIFSKKVVDKLMKKCGPDGFDYLMMLGDPDQSFLD